MHIWLILTRWHTIAFSVVLPFKLHLIAIEPVIYFMPNVSDWDFLSVIDPKFRLQ